MVLSDSVEKYAQIKHSLQEKTTILNKHISGLLCEKTSGWSYGSFMD